MQTCLKACGEIQMPNLAKGTNDILRFGAHHVNYKVEIEYTLKYTYLISGA